MGYFQFSWVLFSQVFSYSGQPEKNLTRIIALIARNLLNSCLNSSIAKIEKKKILPISHKNTKLYYLLNI